MHLTNCFRLKEKIMTNTLPLKVLAAEAAHKLEHLDREINLVYSKISNEALGYIVAQAPGLNLQSLTKSIFLSLISGREIAKTTSVISLIFTDFF